MDLSSFVDMQLRALERINSPGWRAPGEPRWLSGNELEERHFAPQRKATRNIARAVVNVILNQPSNEPLLQEALEKLSESRWRLHFQIAFYKAKKRLESAT